MSPELTTEAENTPQSDEIKTVDFYQPRTVTITRTIKNKSVEFIHQTVKLTDKIWLDFNDTLNPRQTFDGKRMKYADDTEKAVREAYKTLVTDIPAGYQQFFKQELTKENFYSLIPYDDQKSVVESAFAFDISEAETDEFFFDADDSNEFEVDAPINGETATGKIFLRPKTKQDEKDYKKAVEPNFGKVKRFRNMDVSLKSDFAKLQALFASLSAGAGGFETVPVWIQIGMVNFYFTEYAAVDSKN